MNLETTMKPIPVLCNCVPPCGAEHFIAGERYYHFEGVEVSEEEFSVLEDWALYSGAVGP